MPANPCGGCGAESSRRRVVFKGDAMVETCEHCNESLREMRVKSATDRKLWMGHEAEPDRYTRVDKPDGSTVYVANDEKRVDDEADMSREATSQEAKAERIMSQRRLMGNRSPLTPAQILQRRLEIANMMERTSGPEASE